MDTDFYSDQAVEDFVKSTLCQGDKKLFTHYKNNDVKSFRERLSRKFGADEQQILDQSLYAAVTDTIRDLILETIGSMTSALRPAGDLIVSGGEAFNMYFQKEDRIITTDIDTKFCPFFRTGPTEFISSRDPRFFSALQVTELIMWNKLGQLAAQMKTRITQRVANVAASPLGKLLGIRPVKGLFRRYTLIPKKKQFTIRWITY